MVGRVVNRKRRRIVEVRGVREYSTVVKGEPRCDPGRPAQAGPRVTARRGQFAGPCWCSTEHCPQGCPRHLCGVS